MLRTGNDGRQIKKAKVGDEAKIGNGLTIKELKKLHQIRLKRKRIREALIKADESPPPNEIPLTPVLLEGNQFFPEESLVIPKPEEQPSTPISSAIEIPVPVQEPSSEPPMAKKEESQTEAKPIAAEPKAASSSASMIEVLLTVPSQEEPSSAEPPTAKKEEAKTIAEEPIKDEFLSSASASSSSLSQQFFLLPPPKETKNSDVSDSAMSLVSELNTILKKVKKGDESQFIAYTYLFLGEALYRLVKDKEISNSIFNVINDLYNCGLTTARQYPEIKTLIQTQKEAFCNYFNEKLGKSLIKESSGVKYFKDKSILSDDKNGGFGLFIPDVLEIMVKAIENQHGGLQIAKKTLSSYICKHISDFLQTKIDEFPMKAMINLHANEIGGSYRSNSPR